MSSILQEIENQIAGIKTTVLKQNVGIVREIGDGVAKVEGLADAMYNEMLDFGGGVTGLVLNLEETEVGAIILGDYTGIKEGQEVRTTGKLLQVPVGKGLLGRVVNALGVVGHTNLGRAILPYESIDAIAMAAGNYTDLEMSLVTNERASRQDHLHDILCTLTGAEDALVVNNNAAAVLLALTALARGGDVLVGEVWVCSGQSSSWFTVNGSASQVDSMVKLPATTSTSPVAMFGFTTSLRSVTQGRASFSMEFSHFEQKRN